MNFTHQIVGLYIYCTVFYYLISKSSVGMSKKNGLFIRSRLFKWLAISVSVIANLVVFVTKFSTYQWQHKIQN